MDLRLPEKVWIAGKGPSLDLFDWSKSDWCRIGINEAAFIIPNCWAGFAKDFQIVEKYLQYPIDPNILVFVKDTWPQKYTKFKKKFIWNRPKHADILFGTSTTCLQVLYNLGAREFHLIGFDSIDKKESTYSKQISKIGGAGQNQDGYEQINQRLFEVIKKLNLNVIWEHRLCE